MKNSDNLGGGFFDSHCRSMVQMGWVQEHKQYTQL